MSEWINDYLEVAHAHNGCSSTIPGQIGIGKRWFLWKETTGLPEEKPLKVRDRTNNELH